MKSATMLLRSHVGLTIGVVHTHTYIHANMHAYIYTYTLTIRMNKTFDVDVFMRPRIASVILHSVPIPNKAQNLHIQEISIKHQCRTKQRNQIRHPRLVIGHVGSKSNVQQCTTAFYVSTTSTCFENDYDRHLIKSCISKENSILRLVLDSCC